MCVLKLDYFKAGAQVNKCLEATSEGGSFKMCFKD